jgi:hypothetical protein
VDLDLLELPNDVVDRVDDAAGGLLLRDQALAALLVLPEARRELGFLDLRQALLVLGEVKDSP